MRAGTLAAVAALAAVLAGASAEGAQRPGRRVVLAPFPTPEEIEALSRRAETNGGVLPHSRDERFEVSKISFPRFSERHARPRFMDTRRAPGDDGEREKEAGKGKLSDTPYTWWEDWVEELKGSGTK